MNGQATPTLSAGARRARLLTLLEREGEQPLHDLARRFGVSDMTIRRDVQTLAEAGKVLRTHGGAAPMARISFEFRFLERAGQRAPEKEAIAQLAASLVQPGQSVMLDSGTTTLAIARHLRTLAGPPSLTVITTSLPIASELFGIEGIDLFLLGGMLRKDSPDLVGALADRSLESLHADVAFIGTDAVDEQGGLYNASTDVGAMLAKMVRAAATVYAVADSSKVGGRELMRFAQLPDLAALITDNSLTGRQRRALENAGAHVLQPGDPRKHKRS